MRSPLYKCTPDPPTSRSLISLMVSVDVKHYVSVQIRTTFGDLDHVSRSQRHLAVAKFKLVCLRAKRKERKRIDR